MYRPWVTLNVPYEVSQVHVNVLEWQEKSGDTETANVTMLQLPTHQDRVLIRSTPFRLTIHTHGNALGITDIMFRCKELLFLLTDDRTRSIHCLPILCLLLLLLLWSSSTGSSLRSSHGTSSQAQVLLQLLCVHIFTASKHVAFGITITSQLMQLDLHIHKTGIFTTAWYM